MLEVVLSSLVLPFYSKLSLFLSQTYRMKNCDEEVVQNLDEISNTNTYSSKAYTEVHKTRKPESAWSWHVQQRHIKYWKRKLLVNDYYKENK